MEGLKDRCGRSGRDELRDAGEGREQCGGWRVSWGCGEEVMVNAEVCRESWPGGWAG